MEHSCWWHASVVKSPEKPQTGVECQTSFLDLGFLAPAQDWDDQNHSNVLPEAFQVTHYDCLIKVVSGFDPNEVYYDRPKD